MKKNIILAITFSLIFLLSGCSSAPTRTVPVPAVPLTPQLKMGTLNFSLSENHKANITYHTQQEMHAFILSQIKADLNEKYILTDSPEADIININIEYVRQFIGRKLTDSLGYPTLNYSIEIVRKTKVIYRLEKKHQAFNAGIMPNIEVLFGVMRKKSHEKIFMKSIANTISSQIAQLLK
ncbi:hypothetical protein [Vibrio salinus]|uniref:hypothetical protein n=1 Tax=Vibrio salinus TaxID=2899784 RepID=UPI001E3DBD38|nr:hypothetical protein [Vibrio salinus]MCE0495193.1 hypothetical protein [Vibrio salinus]